MSGSGGDMNVIMIVLVAFGCLMLSARCERGHQLLQTGSRRIYPSSAHAAGDGLKACEKDLCRESPVLPPFTCYCCQIKGQPDKGCYDLEDDCNANCHASSIAGAVSAGNNNIANSS